VRWRALRGSFFWNKWRLLGVIWRLARVKGEDRLVLE
jgi:hypothetical protein